MALVRIVYFVTTVFVVFHFIHLHHLIHAIEIIDNSGPDGGQGQGRDQDQAVTDTAGPQNVQFSSPENNSTGIREEMARVIARNRALDDLFREGFSREMWMVFICMGLQNEVAGCRGIPSLETYFSDLPQAGADVQISRRKRFANSWSGSFPDFQSGFKDNDNIGFFGSFGGSHFDTFNNLHNPSFGGSFTGIHPGFNTGFGNAFICPTAFDQSLVYSLDPNSDAYPTDAIAAEIIIGQNPPPGTLPNPIIECLFREMVGPTDPPTIVTEPFRITANATCPFSQLRLYSYQSQAVGSLCWVLQNFQEDVLYRRCTTRFCENCKTKRFNSGFNFRNQKLCIEDYMTVSVWSFCPALLVGTRFIRDRIIIPVYCSCQSIQCQAALDWKK